MPPPAEGFAARFVIGPALRTQPDRRLVTLVREGYENAFEEIVRRYGKPLTRYAAAIVGGRAEDVTQDAFSKALLALRRDGAEIELRPWLFRIVRNTALNDLRDSPPSAEALAEVIAGGASPAEELERREELADLMRRLQSLPEAQRAAIVMRELEGLSHEEIASALGLSDGGARQAIYRARRSLRDGAGMLLPLPLLKALLAGAAGSPAVEAAAGAAGVGGAAGRRRGPEGGRGNGPGRRRGGRGRRYRSQPPPTSLRAAARQRRRRRRLGDDGERERRRAASAAERKRLVLRLRATAGSRARRGPRWPRPWLRRVRRRSRRAWQRLEWQRSQRRRQNRGSGGGSGRHEEPGDDHGGGPGPSGHDGKRRRRRRPPLRAQLRRIVRPRWWRFVRQRRLLRRQRLIR